MTDPKLQLQKEYDVLCDRVANKTSELQQTQAELKNLLYTLVDAPEAKRPALLTKRIELFSLAEVLADELPVLVQRRDLARLAIAEFELSVCVAKVAELSDKVKPIGEARVASESQIRFLYNKPHPDMGSVEVRKKIATLQFELATFELDNQPILEAFGEAQEAMRRAADKVRSIRQEIETE